MEVIPKIFHHIWLNPPMPEQFRRFVNGWYDNHHDWAFWEWNDVNGRQLLAKEPSLQILWDEAEQFCTGKNVLRFRANILRAVILYYHGGVYLDADIECFKSINPLMEPDWSAFISRESASKVRFGNAIMGSEPGHPFPKMLIDKMVYNSLEVKQEKGKVPSYMLNGTKFMSEIVNDLIARKFSNDWGELLADWNDQEKSLQIFDKRYFYPYSYSRLDLVGGPEDYPEAYAAHHWNYERLSRHQPLER